MEDETEKEDFAIEGVPEIGVRVGALTMSPTITKIVGALAKAQADVKPIKKDKKVDAGAKKYKFADLAQVLSATMTALGSHGVAVVQGVSSEQGCVHVTTFLAHNESGEWMSSTLTIPTRDAAQDIGSAITYGRRYSVMAMCGTAPEDDDGKAAHDGAVESGGRDQRSPQRQQPRQQQQRPAQRQDTPAESAFRKILHKYMQEEFGRDGKSVPWKKVASEISGIDPWPDNPTEEQLKSAIGKFEAKMGGGGPS